MTTVADLVKQAIAARIEVAEDKGREPPETVQLAPLLYDATADQMEEMVRSDTGPFETDEWIILGVELERDEDLCALEVPR